MLLATCILSGCDYIESIKGIGFKKAHKLVYENGKDVNTLLRKIRREGKHLIPLAYEETFEKALLTFKFQRVYCPEKQELVFLQEPDGHELEHLFRKYEKDTDFLGPEMNKELANKVAKCEVNPDTMESYVDIMKRKKEKGEKDTRQLYFKKHKEAAKGTMNLKKFFKNVNTNQTVAFELGDHDDIEHPVAPDQNSQPERVKPAAPQFRMRSSQYSS
jgi:5'-3' exonuclease